MEPQTLPWAKDLGLSKILLLLARVRVQALSLAPVLPLLTLARPLSQHHKWLQDRDRKSRE